MHSQYGLAAMEISEDTLAVISFLETLSEGGLRKKNDLSALLELSAQAGSFELANQIIFTGKSVYKLYKTLKNSQNNDVSTLQKQLAATADEMKVLLGQVIPIENEELRKRFEITYFSPTSGCLLNLVDLSADLSVLKEAQSRRKEFFGDEIK